MNTTATMSKPNAGQTRTSKVGLMYRKVPQAVRLQVDQAIVDRPEGYKTLAEIHQAFHLKQDYGVGIVALRNYARRVENIKRKESIGRITAELSPKPETADPATLLKRGHLLLVQRIIQTLEDGELSTSELARMAQAYTSQRKLSLETEKDAHASSQAPDRIAELVREIYGVHMADE